MSSPHVRMTLWTWCHRWREEPMWWDWRICLEKEKNWAWFNKSSIAGTMSLFMIWMDKEVNHLMTCIKKGNMICKKYFFSFWTHNKKQKVQMCILIIPHIILQSKTSIASLSTVLIFCWFYPFMVETIHLLIMEMKVANATYIFISLFYHVTTKEDTSTSYMVGAWVGGFGQGRGGGIHSPGSWTNLDKQLVLQQM